MKYLLVCLLFLSALSPANAGRGRVLTKALMSQALVHRQGQSKLAELVELPKSSVFSMSNSGQIQALQHKLKELKRTHPNFTRELENSFIKLAENPKDYRPLSLSAKDFFEMSAENREEELFWAILNTDQVKVKNLLEAGTDPNSTNGGKGIFTFTPLLNAIKGPIDEQSLAANRQIIQDLLDHGANPNLSARASKVGELGYDKYGDYQAKWSPLMLAMQARSWSWEDKKEVVAMLAKAGAEPAIKMHLPKFSWGYVTKTTEIISPLELVGQWKTSALLSISAFSVKRYRQAREMERILLGQ